MVRLSLTFLNTFHVRLASQPITRFRSSNNRGLLVYLALQYERSFPREVLATLLWPEVSDNDARNNLRQSLYQLRKVLGDLDYDGEPYLLVTRQTVQFNPDSNFILDVDQFYRAIETGDLETAVSHYQGELLPGFNSDSVQFEDWLRQEREHLHQIALKVMSELTQNYLRDGRFEKAQSTARRQLSLEPWREQAYCQSMQAYALAGDRGSALAQFEVCKEVLWDELAVEPTAETVTIYENIKAGNYSPTAAAVSLIPPAEHRHNLPVYVTPFIGREAELEKLDAYIVDPNVRLVTIVGPGGIGKTRLGIAAVERARLSDMFPEGLFFIDLASLPEATRIVQAVADALNFPLQGGAGQFREQLLDYLRQKKMLIFFDNFEHLLDGADLVADMLQAGPEVMILVTSRERLNLLPEQLYPIEGLEFPDWETPEDAAEYTAVRLFLQSARRIQPEFAIRDDGDLTFLARICGTVMGMPLALELAASWVDKLTLEEIANELQRGMGILQTELRDVPERQRSVQASFDYSWGRLEEVDQVVFTQLSIFRGGFTRQAAQQVTGATLHGLSRLVNKSLVRFDKQRGRYEVHELLRQYGADKLGRESTLEAATRDRHSKYYCQLLAGYTDDLKGAGKAQALSTIEADIENVRLAWIHASTQQDLAALSKSYEALWRFYYDFGRAEVSIFEKAVADLRTGKAMGARGIVLGQLLAPLGRFYALVGDTAKAREILEESLDLLQRLEASEESLMPLLFLAEVQGSLEESNRLYQEGLDLARAIGDQWAIGHALVFLGLNARLRGDYQMAEQQSREALQQFRQNSGDTGGIVFTLSLLSLLATDGGEYEDAVVLAREAISLSQGFNPVFRLMGSGPLGIALYALGKYEEAEEQFKQGLTVFEEFRREDWGGWLFWLGKIAFAKKDYARATQQFQESLAKAVVRDDQAWIIQIRDALGRVELAQSRGIEARKHFRAALQTALTIDQRPLLLECLTSVAELFTQEGNLEYAVRLATLTASDPSSQAMNKERSARILNRIAAELSPDQQDSIRQRIWQSDVGILTDQLLVDLEVPSPPSHPYTPFKEV